MKFALLRMPMGRMSMLPFGQNGVADSLCAPNDTVCIEVSRGKASLRGWLAEAGDSSAGWGRGGAWPRHSGQEGRGGRVRVEEVC